MSECIQNMYGLFINLASYFARLFIFCINYFLNKGDKVFACIFSESIVYILSHLSTTLSVLQYII